jgi:hypothetical protein
MSRLNTTYILCCVCKCVYRCKYINNMIAIFKYIFYYMDVLDCDAS